MDYPLVSSGGSRYREIEYNGQPAREYENGAIMHAVTGKALKPMINRENAESMQKKGILSRRERKREQVREGIKLALQDIMPDLGDLDPGQVESVLAGMVTHVVAEGGNAGVKAYSELMRDLGMRDRDSGSVKLKDGGRSVELSGMATAELVRLIQGFDNSNYRNHEDDSVLPGDWLPDSGDDTDDSDTNTDNNAPPHVG